MFTNDPGLAFKARIAIQAKSNEDPRYDELVSKLMERMGWVREDVEQAIINLCFG